MARHPAWFERLDALLEVVRESRLDWLGRNEIGITFPVQRTRHSRGHLENSGFGPPPPISFRVHGWRRLPDALHKTSTEVLVPEAVAEELSGAREGEQRRRADYSAYDDLEALLGRGAITAGALRVPPTSHCGVSTDAAFLAPASRLETFQGASVHRQ